MTAPRKQLLEALDLALAGDWQGAHRIVQEREGDPIADWIHAVVHRIEGDLDNARYWYRQAGRTLPAEQPVNDELAGIRDALARDETVVDGAGVPDREHRPRTR